MRRVGTEQKLAREVEEGDRVWLESKTELYGRVTKKRVVFTVGSVEWGFDGVVRIHGISATGDGRIHRYDANELVDIVP